MSSVIARSSQERETYIEPIARIPVTTIFILLDIEIFCTMKMGRIPQNQSAPALRVE